MTWRRLPKIGRPDVVREAQEEIEHHLELRVQELVEKGVPLEQARAQAAQAFGDRRRVQSELVALDREMERRRRWTQWLGELGRDAVFGLRQWKRSPGFAVLALATLALGIGATTAIFSAVHAVLLRPLPFPQSDRIVLVTGWRLVGASDTSAGNFVDWRRNSKSFDPLIAIDWESFNIGGAAEPERVMGAKVSRGFFRLFGIPPALGRWLDDSEDVPGRERVVVLSDRFWRRRFAADRGILGRDILLNNVPHRVVGVMPPAFDFVADSEELWTPVAFTPEREAMHDEHYLTTMARLKDGVSLEQARSEMAIVAAQSRKDFPQENQALEIRIEPYAEWLFGPPRQRLTVWLGAVLGILLIACGNVGNLLLARGSARSSEAAIRAALGAGRRRLLRQLLTENVVLALGGAALGLLVAQVILRALRSSSWLGLPRLEQARLDLPTLLFAAALALVCSLLAGLLPAIRTARADLQTVLRNAARPGSSGIGRDRARQVLIGAEIALSLALLVVAGVFLRRAADLSKVDLGFEPRGVLTARLTLPADGYKEAEVVEAAFDRLVAEAAAIPGVSAAGVTSQVPMGPGGNSNGLVPEGRPRDIEHSIDSRLRLVTPGYFQAMGIPLRKGRLFDDRDRRGNLRVMVISESLAQAAYPGEDPLGKRMLCCEGNDDDPMWKTVVGVVADVRSRGPARDVQPEFYLPTAQAPRASWDWIQRTMTLAVRSSGADPASLATPVRLAASRVDPLLPLYGLATMEERRDRVLSETRFTTTLLTALGGLGLLLSAIGIYGVIAYFVAQRAPEIGVRIALGATTRDILLFVVRHSLAPVAGGLTVGILAAFAATRLLRSQLTGAEALPPSVLASGIGVLVLAAMAASLVPAMRALKVDPKQSLAG
ncbi:MAG TPA: ABC transporter permease [Thermoanaerobaculia bacterium]